MRIKARS
jgi:hypothetical protein